MSLRIIAFYLAFFSCFFVMHKANGQTSETRWMSSISAVFLDYQGPITKDYFQYRTFNPGVQFGASAYAAKWLNVSLNSSFVPEVQYPQKLFPATFPDSISYRNTSLVDVNALLHFKANGTILPENFFIAPYIAAGFGANSASNILRLYVPGAFGINFQISRNFNVRVQSTYQYAIEENTFQPITHSVGFVFGLGSKKSEELPPIEEPPVEEEDTPVAMQLDSDGDGIPDKDDRCPDVKGLIMYLGCPPDDVPSDEEEPKEDIAQNVPIDDGGTDIPVDTNYPDDTDNYDNSTYNQNQGYGGEISPEDIAFLESADQSIHFHPGSKELTPKSLPTLDRISEILKKHPNYGLDVGGYTDDSGDAKANKTLSVERAFEVKYYLVYRRGISMSRITSNGYGSANPIADNSTAEGRNRNRRVEFKLKQPGYKVPKIF